MIADNLYKTFASHLIVTTTRNHEKLFLLLKKKNTEIDSYELTNIAAYSILYCICDLTFWNVSARTSVPLLQLNRDLCLVRFTSYLFYSSDNNKISVKLKMYFFRHFSICKVLNLLMKCVCFFFSFSLESFSSWWANLEFGEAWIIGPLILVSRFIQSEISLWRWSPWIR